jgi:hypothetical protein
MKAVLNDYDCVKHHQLTILIACNNDGVTNLPTLIHHTLPLIGRTWIEGVCRWHYTREAVRDGCRKLCDCAPNNCYKDCKEKDIEMFRTCSTNGRDKKFVENIYWETKLYRET